MALQMVILPMSPSSAVLWSIYNNAIHMIWNRNEQNNTAVNAHANSTGMVLDLKYWIIARISVTMSTTVNHGVNRLRNRKRCLQQEMKGEQREVFLLGVEPPDWLPSSGSLSLDSLASLPLTSSFLSDSEESRFWRTIARNSCNFLQTIVFPLSVVQTHCF